MYLLYSNAYKLLLDIARNKTCSEVSVKALKVIKFCAIVISAFVVAGILVVAIFSKVIEWNCWHSSVITI